MVKFLRAFFVAAVMAALCLVPALAAPAYPDSLPPSPDPSDYLMDESVTIAPENFYVYVFRDVEIENHYYWRFVADPDRYYYDSDRLNFCVWESGQYLYGGYEYWDGWTDFYPYISYYNITEWDLNLVRESELVYASGRVYGPDGNILYEDGFVHPDLVPDPPYEGPKPVPEKNLIPSHSYDSPSYLADPDSEIDFEAPGDPSNAEDPFTQLNLMVGSIFGILTQIYNLYAGTWLLTGFLMLWLIRKVAKLFNKL